MEKGLTKPATSWPSLADSGWMDRFFNSPIDEFFSFPKVMNVPAVNISETDKAFKIEIAAPGLKKEDFKVEVRDNMISISAQKEIMEEKPGRYNRREYNYSSWSRLFTLPDSCNSAAVDAGYKDGELSINIPKMASKEIANVKKVMVN